MEIRQFRNTQYEVSDDGRVFSTDYKRTGKRGEIKPSQDKDGYYQVNLHFEGKSVCIKVHRMVAECFIDNPNNYPFINHKNEVKTDNRVKNLEWCTRNYNRNYGTCSQRIGKALVNRPNQSRKIAQLDKDGNVIQIFPSVNEAIRQLKISESNLRSCCSGKQKTAGGFRWKYVE